MKNELPKNPGKEPVFTAKPPNPVTERLEAFDWVKCPDLGDNISIPNEARCLSIEMQQDYDGVLCEQTIVFYRGSFPVNPNYEQELKDYQEKEEEFKRTHKEWAIENAKWNIYMNEKRIANYKNEIKKLENSVLGDKKKLVDS